MSQINLEKYGITGSTEIVYNPSYEVLFEEETKAGLEGFEVGQETELGAVNVMTGIYTGRSPKDKFIVKDAYSADKVWWTTEEYKNDNKPVTEEAWATIKDLAVKELVKADGIELLGVLSEILLGAVYVSVLNSGGNVDLAAAVLNKLCKGLGRKTGTTVNNDGGIDSLIREYSMYSTEHSLNKRLVCNGQLVILAEYGYNAIFREVLDCYGTSVSLDKVARVNRTISRERDNPTLCCRLLCYIIPYG